MPRRREKKHPINDFFRRLGFTFISLAVLVGCVGLLYILFHIFSFECPVKALIGFDCPGCGLTRAGAKLLSFNFVGAWEQNPVSYYIALWVALTAVRYLFKGNFKKIMSVWWILTLLIPWLAIWAYMTFLA